MGASAAVAVAGVPSNAQAALAGDPLLAMEREWRAFRDYCNNYPDESDEARNPLYDRLADMELEIYKTPATALAGVVVKLRLWGNYYTSFACDNAYEEAWWRGDLAPMGLDETGFAYVMRDLERLAGVVRS